MTGSVMCCASRCGGHARKNCNTAKNSEHALGSDSTKLLCASSTRAMVSMQALEAAHSLSKHSNRSKSSVSWARKKEKERNRKKQTERNK